MDCVFHNCSSEVTPAENNKSKPEANGKGNITTVSSKTETPVKDVKEAEAEDEEGTIIYPYECVKTTSTDPVKDIDITKREVCCISSDYFV